MNNSTKLSNNWFLESESDATIDSLSSLKLILFPEDLIQGDEVQDLAAITTESINGSAIQELLQDHKLEVDSYLLLLDRFGVLADGLNKKGFTAEKIKSLIDLYIQEFKRAKIIIE